MNNFFAFHQAIDGYFSRNEDNTMTLRCRVMTDATIDKAYIRIEPNNEEVLIEMTQEDLGSQQWWSGTIAFDPGNSVTLYVFKFLSSKQQWWLDGRGVQSFMPGRESHFRVSHDVEPADWIYDQVFYQIFPDRFNRCDSIEPDRPLHSWGETLTHEERAFGFHGGNLPGIEQQLDYIQDLGVTALYLNPIFLSSTNHRYNIDDYHQIDPLLGDESHLVSLISNVHQRGMKILLDAVVNHTSNHHQWFNTQFDEFYSLREAGNPGSYHCWNGFKQLPELNYACEGVQQNMYAGDSAFLRHWMRAPYHIDGWRLDAVHMVGEGGSSQQNAFYVKAICDAIRAENDQAYVLGEHFYEASQWLQGDQEDGAMNYYGFAHPIRAFLAGQDIAYHPIQISAQDFEQWLSEARAKIPFKTQLAQFNLLDSHDTARFYWMLEENDALMRIAVAILFCYPGVPCIFYGDEVGMSGGNDPDCRGCFDWDSASWNQPMRAFYQQMITWRKELPALRYGAYLPLVAQDDVWAFARVYQNEAVVLIVNRGETQHNLVLSSDRLGWDNVTMTDLMNGNEVGSLPDAMAPQSFRLFKLVKEQ